MIKFIQCFFHEKLFTYIWFYYIMVLQSIIRGVRDNERLLN